jgi:SAM-dependent methyltransferase
VLDAGCGSGGNLALLARFGRVFGFEYDAEAEAVATALHIGTVSHGALPDGIPFSGTSFDAIGLFDVLEHLEHPVESLRALGDRLTPGGALIITVPALPWLWGPHDDVHQHYRRYTSALLARHVHDAGLRIEYMSYLNTLLLPLAIAQRVKERLFGYRVQQLTPSPALNALLYRIWRLELAWIPRRRLPIGLSLMAIVRRPTASESSAHA